MKPRLLALALLLSLPLPLLADVFAQAATAEMIRRLVPASATSVTSDPVLQGRFIQARRLSDLPKPLLSSGRFVFARDRGVLWQVEKPFVSEFVLTPVAMITREGGRERRMAAHEQPGLNIATRLFSALFTLDIAALEKDFTLFGAGDAKAWTLGFKPKHAALEQHFATATIQGGSSIEAIRMTDARGDVTDLKLSGIAHAKALSSADAQRFP
jgi:hypothetical protein